MGWEGVSGLWGCAMAHPMDWEESGTRIKEKRRRKHGEDKDKFLWGTVEAGLSDHRGDDGGVQEQYWLGIGSLWSKDNHCGYDGKAAGRGGYLYHGDGPCHPGCGSSVRACGGVSQEEGGPGIFGDV